MSKHKHHQSMAEQIVNKGHASAPFHCDNNSIQLRAYQIYQEKGGTDQENWLEAERILRNSDQTVSSFINDGNPT